ncbi:MAG: division/cell wall cluster transcriptional repressor MraZ [Gammaproteobacteria bacterium]
MFGYNEISIDSKGRISAPARYRENFTNSKTSKLIITRDPQYPCLKMYPEESWNNLSNSLQKMQSLDPVIRKLQWTILGHASELDLDPAERMLLLIPADLRSYAGINLSEKIAFIGMGDKFEIWNLENWHLRQDVGQLSTEILEIVLPESVRALSL